MSYDNRAVGQDFGRACLHTRLSCYASTETENIPLFIHTLSGVNALGRKRHLLERLISLPALLGDIYPSWFGVSRTGRFLTTTVGGNFNPCERRRKKLLISLFWFSKAVDKI